MSISSPVSRPASAPHGHGRRGPSTASESEGPSGTSSIFEAQAISLMPTGTPIQERYDLTTVRVPTSWLAFPKAVLSTYAADSVGSADLWVTRTFLPTTLTATGLGTPTSLAASAASRPPFALAAGRLVEYLKSFDEVTRDWQEFQRAPFPSRAIEAALEFLEQSWDLVDVAGRAAIANAFCGPGEDGTVNCQWSGTGQFLALTIDESGLRSAYFNDESLGEEWEGAIEASEFARLLERVH